MKWNTQEVIDLLSTIPDTRIDIVSPGGDCDTENLYIFSTLEQPTVTVYEGERYERQNAVTLCGLVEQLGIYIDDPANPSVDIAYIELRTLDSDSSGGIDEDASDEIIRIFYAAKKKLKEAYGKSFSVVGHYKQVY